MKTSTLTPKLLRLTDACWRAANHLSAGQIYLYDNLRMPAPNQSAADQAGAKMERRLN
ncbi:MAG TPA: hypothetical protein VN048_12955 [Verrucomicrobiae bacterium]|nr:hypothetical protein [Verrucomicrobiae bacterium]